MCLFKTPSHFTSMTYMPSLSMTQFCDSKSVCENPTEYQVQLPFGLMLNIVTVIMLKKLCNLQISIFLFCTLGM